MRILSFFPILKKTRRFQRIIITEFPPNEFQSFIGSLFGDSGGIGAHIGNQSDGSTRTQFNTFIKLLRDQHCFFS